MGGLPGPVVLEGGPGGARPDVVELPDEDAVALGERAPPGDGGFEAEGLLELGEIDQIGRGTWVEQIVNPLQDILVAAGLADVGFLLLHIGKEGGEGGMAELRDEAGAVLVIFRQRAGVLGDIPEVHITLRIIIPAVGIIVPGAAARRGGPIHPLRVQGGHQIPTKVYKSFIVRQVQLRISLPDPLVHIVHPLIVSAPHRDGRVTLQAFYLMGQFRADFPKEFRCGRIHRAGEHHIVPDQKTQRIADLIEGVLLKLAAAPEPQHIHIGVPGRCQKVQIAAVRLPRRIRLAGNPVGAPGEYRLSIHLEGQILPCLDGPETDFLHERLPVDGNARLVERLLPHSGRPPEPGLPDLKDLRHDIRSRLEIYPPPDGLPVEGKSHLGIPAFRRIHFRL